MTQDEVNAGRCSKRQTTYAECHKEHKHDYMCIHHSPRCLLDEGHTGRHNYNSPKFGDEVALQRFHANRSERGMM